MAHTLLRAQRRFWPAAVLMLPLGLSGCGGIDGVEFNGRIFDAVGLTGALGKREEPKTEARAPLVLPPPRERLPAPGEVAAVAPPQPDAAWPNDPDKTKATKEASAKKAQDDYCRDGNWKEKAMKDEVAAAHGPGGTCGSFFSILNKTLFGD